MTAADRTLLRRAKQRLDALGLYPRPVDLDGVRRAYATRHQILLKRRPRAYAHPPPEPAERQASPGRPGYLGAASSGVGR